MKKLYTANGKEVPMIGLGTFPLQGEQIADVLLQALNMGYQLIDTSDDYRGETGIGMAITRLRQQKRFCRGDLFIQTKISADYSYFPEPLAGIYFNKYSSFMKRHTVDEVVREKVSISLREMKTDYLDSLLIHLPYENYFLPIWNTMIQLKEEGKVRYLGVSNFHKRHIEILRKTTGVMPDINEIYVSPLGIKQDQIDYANENNIQIMTYSPLMDLHAGRIDESDLKPLMNKYNKSAAQIILRWNIERVCMPLPKTKSERRLKENFDIFDFQLNTKEVQLINNLNKDYQYLIESKICPGI